MRSSDREIIQFIDQLIQLGNQVISETEQEKKRNLLEDYLTEIKDLYEWPHKKQVNPLITMRIKNIDIACFTAYLNDLPIESYQFIFFKTTIHDREAFIHKQVNKNKLALEAIRYFYKSKI